MPAKNFLFCLSFKNGAFVMAAINLAFGAAAILGCSVELYYHKSTNQPASQEEWLYLVMGIFMGFYNLGCFSCISYAMLHANDSYVLLYMMLEMMNLLTLSVFSGVNMIFKESILLSTFFLITLILWYCLYCMYGFYKELLDYNSVKSGTMEISYQGQINPLMNLPEAAMDNTAV